jgi:hypothetical protein
VRRYATKANKLNKQTNKQKQERGKAHGDWIQQYSIFVLLLTREEKKKDS